MSKKALLMVSFGTSHLDTRKKNIEEIGRTLQQHFFDHEFYEAYTSKMIIQALKKKDIMMNDVKQAMELMKKNGVTEVLVQPTHVLPGIEYEQMMDDLRKFTTRFQQIKIGEPLLHDTSDCEIVVDTVGTYLESCHLQQNSGVILMGHGTQHDVNPIYCKVDDMLKQRGYTNVHVATVEAVPSIEDVIETIKKYSYHHIFLLPFMIVAGDHAKNDMAGENEGSYYSKLKKEGYVVTFELKGLGEYPAIRELILQHATQAKFLGSDN